MEYILLKSDTQEIKGASYYDNRTNETIGINIAPNQTLNISIFLLYVNGVQSLNYWLFGLCSSFSIPKCILNFLFTILDDEKSKEKFSKSEYNIHATGYIYLYIAAVNCHSGIQSSAEIYENK
jgi:hypothetical protein